MIKGSITVLARQMARRHRRHPGAMRTHARVCAYICAHRDQARSIERALFARASKIHFSRSRTLLHIIATYSAI